MVELSHPTLVRISRHQKTRIVGLPDDEEIMTLAFLVLTQYRLVTDRRTDRHVRITITRASIASRW